MDSDAACSLISAMMNDKKEVHIVNVKNQGAIGGLGADDVVEVPALIKRSGAYPLVMGEMPLSVRALIQTVKTYELLTVQAAVEGSRDAAILALANHPLVPTIDIAEKLFDRILEANREWLPQFS